MNLIERLGGYEKAKEWYIDQDLRGNHTTRIRAALLEYRRQHNIFEEHDWVVIPSQGNGLFSVSRLLCRSDRDEMRHATPKEITQGYRDE